MELSIDLLIGIREMVQSNSEVNLLVLYFMFAIQSVGCVWDNGVYPQPRGRGLWKCSNYFHVNLVNGLFDV